MRLSRLCAVAMDAAFLSHYFAHMFYCADVLCGSTVMVNKMQKIVIKRPCLRVSSMFNFDTRKSSQMHQVGRPSGLEFKSLLLLKPQGCRWRKWAWLAGRGRHTLRCQPARSRRWALEMRVFTHAHVSMIADRVEVYRTRPIGAYLLTTSPQQGCLALKRLHTGDGWVWWRVYPLNTDLDWGRSSVNYQHILV